MLYSHTIKLVRFYQRVDGLKTGYTSSAGYCLTATANKDNMRLIAVVMGEEDSKVRNSEITEMLNYGFAQYKSETLISKNKILGIKNVEKGKKDNVEIVPIEDVKIINKKSESKKKVTYEIKVKTIKAPVKKGDIVGNLYIKEKNKIIMKTDLTVKENIEKVGYTGLYFKYIKNIIRGI